MEMPLLNNFNKNWLSINGVGKIYTGSTVWEQRVQHQFRSNFLYPKVKSFQNKWFLPLDNNLSKPLLYMKSNFKHILLKKVSSKMLINAHKCYNCSKKSMVKRCVIFTILFLYFLTWIGSFYMNMITAE